MTSCVAIAQLSVGRKTFKQATSAGASRQKQKEKVNRCTAPRMDTCALRQQAAHWNGGFGHLSWWNDATGSTPSAALCGATAGTPW